MEKDRRLERLERRLEKLERLERNQFRNNKFWLFTISLFIIFGSVFAGSHYANQILTGTFLGNYSFNSSVSFSEQPSIKQSYYYLPKNSDFVVNTSNSNCVDNGANYKCAYEPDLDGDGCPDDMARVGDVCIDKYEASYNCSIYTTQATVGSGGAITTDGSNDYDDYLWQTRGMVQINSAPAGCQVKSKNHSIPYTTITQYDAKQSCLLAGKHLVKNSDWQKAVFSTPDDDTKCNIKDGDSGSGEFISGASWYNQGGDDAIYTGSAGNCHSKYGIYDMIGNVWEWTDDLMDPKNTSIDYPINSTYGDDYIWRQDIDSLSAREGSSHFIAAFRRGGDWNDDVRAGAFALPFNDCPSNWMWNFGFRCSSEPRS